jgi:predicted acetyltransferase
MAAQSATIARPAAPGRPRTPTPPPFEIRSTRRDELEQVLAVRCDAFEQPPETWPDLLNRPEPALAQIRVVVCEGRVVSSLEVRREQVQIGDAVLGMGGVCNVATLTTERNHGYASALMRDTLRSLRTEGTPTSVLFPFSFRYYRKFGYELAGNHCQFWCRPHNLPAFGEHNSCRKAAEEDIPHLERVYRYCCSQRSCSLVRPPARWRELIRCERFRVIVYQREGAEGYMILRDSQDHYGGKLLAVEELGARTAEARRGLIGHLARYSGEAIEWYACAQDLAESGVLRSVAPLREGFKPRGIATVRPMFQFRVVDVLAALQARAGSRNGAAGALSLRIRDELLRENERPLTLSADDGTLRVDPGRENPHWLEADIRAFSQIFCGYLSAAEGVSQGLMQASSLEAVELADALFPRLEPFIPQIDRF